MIYAASSHFEDHFSDRSLQFQLLKYRSAVTDTKSVKILTYFKILTALKILYDNLITSEKYQIYDCWIF